MLVKRMLTKMNLSVNKTIILRRSEDVNLFAAPNGDGGRVSANEQRKYLMKRIFSAVE